MIGEGCTPDGCSREPITEKMIEEMRAAHSIDVVAELERILLEEIEIAKIKYSVMKKKIAVVALIYQDEMLNSDILAVSRKNDHNDFGLPGGKIESADETIYHGLVREVLEETGIEIESAEPIFTREDNEYIAIVFLVTKWKQTDATLDPSETGKVEFTNFETLKRGSFGAYNTKLEKHIEILKTIFK